MHNRNFALKPIKTRSSTYRASYPACYEMLRYYGIRLSARITYMRRAIVDIVLIVSVIQHVSCNDPIFPGKYSKY